MNKSKTTKLKQLATKNETSKATFTFLSMRERNTAVTNMTILRSNLKELDVRVNRDHFDDIFLSLEKLGIGKVIRSPRGKIQKFLWEEPVIEVAKIATSEIRGIPEKEDLVTIQVPRKDYELLRKSLNVLHSEIA